MSSGRMYWRRNLQALLLQGVALVVLCIWMRNLGVILVATFVMCYAVIHATTRDGEIAEWLTDCLCSVVLSRPVLVVLAGLVNALTWVCHVRSKT